MDAVTTFLPAWRHATIAATSSMYLIIAPPKTFPSTLASVGIMSLAVLISDSDGFFPRSFANGCAGSTEPDKVDTLKDRWAGPASDSQTDACGEDGKLRLPRRRREEQRGDGGRLRMGDRTD